MKKTQGFTIIELMIAIAIIGVLAAIAVPAYSNYLTRAKVSEGVNMISPFKVAMSECIHTHGDITDCQAGAPGMPNAQSGDYATVALTKVDGEIQVTFGPKASGNKVDQLPTDIQNASFTLTANFAKNDGSKAITFSCTAATPALVPFLPSSLGCK